MSSFFSSKAKWPASSRWISVSCRSRLNASAPGAMNEGSFRPQTTKIGGLCSRNPQPSPHFSYEGEGLSQGSALSDVFAKPLDERPQADLWHVRDQLVEHAALAEERMGPVFGRVGLEMPIHA